jgi:hypothetical protein
MCPQIHFLTLAVSRPRVTSVIDSNFHATRMAFSLPEMHNNMALSYNIISVHLSFAPLATAYAVCDFVTQGLVRFHK